MPRNHEITVKLTREEFDKIQRKASELSLKPSQFLRLIGLSAKFEVLHE